MASDENFLRVKGSSQARAAPASKEEEVEAAPAPPPLVREALSAAARASYHSRVTGGRPATLRLRLYLFLLLETERGRRERERERGCLFFFS